MKGHPWHPAFVHFPIALWTVAALIDVLELFGWIPARVSALSAVEPVALSFPLLWLGVVLAIPAMLAGLVDLLRLPEEIQTSPTLNSHVVVMAGAWTIFLVAALLRPVPEPPFPRTSGTVTLLEVAGFAALTIGGRLAAAVVFKDWPRSA